MIRSFLVLIGFLTAALAHAAGPLDNAPRDGWWRYRVAMVEGVQAPCCPRWSHTRNGMHCSLDIDEIDKSKRPQRSQPGDTITILIQRNAGAVTDVQISGTDCASTLRTPMADGGELALDASLALLTALVDGTADAAKARKRLTRDAVAAIAYHAGDSATRTLIGYADASRPWHLRDSAIFWLGQNRGRDGVTTIERIARGDASEKARNHAVFSLSQAPSIDAFDILVDIAEHDASNDVRGQTLFWLAQGDSPARAEPVILAALRRDKDRKVQDQAVFALSQLDGRGDQALIGVIRGDFPRQAKRQAVFWLGQSGSPEAMRFLDQTLGAAETAQR
jgi:HEAT repeat protein